MSVELVGVDKSRLDTIIEEYRTLRMRNRAIMEVAAIQAILGNPLMKGAEAAQVLRWRDAYDAETEDVCQIYGEQG